MRRESHVRFCEGGGVRVLSATRLVVGFEHESDARRFWDAMRDRLREFSLSLHPDKTRLIEFGRYAAQNRKRRGLGKPETFKFLGFVLICGKSRRGGFLVKRKSRRDRMRARLQAIKEELRQRMHQPIPATGKWLTQVVSGFFAYHAVPTNGAAIGAFRYHVTILWRPSQSESPAGVGADEETGGRLPPEAENPSPVAKRPLRRQTPEVGAECPNWARSDLCGGRPEMSVSTANKTAHPPDRQNLLQRTAGPVQRG
jgi:RNA-directed DNA polymerase